ncbi:bifunctional RNase H/acid phosphatase [Planosporangium sp. 12N6]|uniref:bifunctional RNase H/acid phosphatase n=1 Tax=Planosporangium spinosum TaxID=3402278 RepID=UPI003CF9FA8B
MKLVVEADGGSRGNPGTAGYGAVVLDPDTGEVLAQRLGALGVTTNNIAEYQGLIAGLAAAAELGADSVEVRMDSKLVVEQMSGRWQIKHPGLRPLAAQAADLVRRFRSVTFTWIPRERNKRADALANAAMDGRPAPADPAPVAAATAPAATEPTSSTNRAAAAPAGTGSWVPPTGPATRLILVRHGETEYTVRRLYSGRGEAALTPHGLAQARAAAQRVAAQPVAAVVTSPLSRCTRTAELVAQAAGGVPVRTDADLVECDFGAWEGLSFAQVSERWPDEMREWLASPAHPPPGGESFDEVARRVSRAVERLRAEYPGGRVVVVSHVSPIKLVLRDALAAGPAFLHRCYLDPAGLSTVDFWPDGGIAVRGVNETGHLPGIA